MSRYEAVKRDGLARIGTFEHDGEIFSLPAALDTDDLFPALDGRALSNVPLSSGEAFVRDYFSSGEGEQPVAVHPLAPGAPQSGDCTLVANWHTVLANPRNYATWLIGLKGNVPPDTAWYAPAAALPSNACLLIYSGFDLFDYRAVDLASAQKKFCLPEGEFLASMMETGVCGCEGCRAGDLAQHNRLALDREIALVRHHIGAGRLRELMESRCRSNAAQVGILRFLDQNYEFMERSLPV
ncbi:MAG: pseudouridine synthase, partial [Methanomicrobiales archaeon]|nr:pseudouridine synthase [Methanomicrobiales archaeon]